MKLAIHESRNSEKVIAFANEGYGMSKRWWKKTFELNEQGQLWGVYQVPSGLRRTVV